MTRETLAKLAEKFEHDHPYGVALRDVLTPRTCGTCRHTRNEKPIDGWVWCFRKDQMWHVDDGCIKGWQARGYTMTIDSPRNKRKLAVSR